MPLHAGVNDGLLTLPTSTTDDQFSTPLRAILEKKGSVVHAIPRSSTVAEALTLMNEMRIGCVVVLDDGCLCGVFTERDVLVRVVGEYRDPRFTFIQEVMNSHVHVATPATTLGEALKKMVTLRFRHLPVVDRDGHLVGIVSSGDITAWLATNLGTMVHQLECYIQGAYL
jgi:CBS domain-containing protein